MKFDVKAAANQVAFSFNQNKPKILMIGGILGVLTGGFMACKATLHLEETLDEHKEAVKTARSKPEDEQSKEVTKVYIQTGVKLAKLYGPAIVVETLSIAGIVDSNHILQERNVALAAAYTAVDTSFKQYRKGVVDRFGEEVDQEISLGTHKEKLEETITDEDGKKKKIKKSVDVVGNGLPNEYARYFAYREAKAAEPSDAYNRMYLTNAQETANIQLKAKGFLFLNEVYTMLGIDPSIAGQAVGWIYDKQSEDHGDNYVDLGIKEVYRHSEDDPDLLEKVFVINPNVDGSILEHGLDKGLLTN